MSVIKRCLACLLCLVLSCAPGIVSQTFQPPSTGVLLYNEQSDTVLPNNTILRIGTIGGVSSGMGLACYTALRGTNEVGRWFFPNGAMVNSAPTVVSALQRLERVVLFINSPESFGPGMEGVYTCCIPDENNAEQILYAGIYRTDNSGGPRVLSPVQFQLLTNLSTQPPSFSLNCTSTDFPATTVTWTRDGQLLDNSEEHQMSQTLRDAPSATYDNILTVQGNLTGSYRCEVGNDRGSGSVNLDVTAPSGPPVNLTAEVLGNNSVRLMWVPPDNVEGYQLLYHIDTNPEMSENIAGPVSEYVLQDVEGDREHTVSLVAFAQLPSERSEPITFLLEVPDPPTTVDAVAQSSSEITVTWSPSPDSSTTGYRISYTPETDCPGIQGGSETVGNVTEHTLTDLEEDIQYNITVSAVNGVGFGPPSAAETGTTQPARPSAPPESVEASASGPSAIDISWQPPNCSDINSEVLSGYTIKYESATSSSEMNVPSTRVSFTISSLTTFTVYTVQVAATNGEGRGPFSNPLTVTLVDEPGRVEMLTISPDIVSVVLTWSPPVNGRNFITRYELSYMLGGNNDDTPTIVDVTGNITSHRVTGLRPDTFYVIGVTAFTDAGGSLTERDTTTTNDIGPVQNVMFEFVSDTAVNVSWDRLPSEDVSNYIVFYTPAASVGKRQSPGEERFSGQDSSGVVSNLQRGVEYQFEVAAEVMVDGELTPGERTVAEQVEESSADDGGGDNATALIVGVVLGGLIVLILLLIIAIIVVFYLWKRQSSGKLVINSTLEMKKRRPSPLPLPDFDSHPGINIPSAMPIIEEYPRDTIVVEGEGVVLHPKVIGNPPPTIAWYHEGCMVSSDYSIDLDEHGKITIASVEPRHAGTYRFTVSNSVGSVQGQVSLFVHTENSDEAFTTKGAPKVESEAVTVEEFGQYIAEKHGSNNRGFRDQFLCLDAGEHGRRVTMSTRPENKPHNRFNNITVYDDNRIILTPIPGWEHDYINAAYVDGYSIPKKFAATQGPKEETVVDFWRMVWQLRCPSIVMITNLKEGDRIKCEQYWPATGTKEYGPFQVTLTDQQAFANYTIRMFLLSITTKPHTYHNVVQYQFTAWPDHGVPEYATAMLAFHRRIVTEHKVSKGPLLVHCSAGVGRTGTFIALDIALQQADNEGMVDVPAIITKIRRQRMKMVQTAEQYAFIHDAVLEALTCGNTRIHAHDLRRRMESLSQPDIGTEATGFQQQFRVLSQVTPRPDPILCPTALQNPDKNRYTDFLPTDRWRVVLKAEHPDYIHASFVNGYKQKKAMIIAQGPLPNTCRDFWKMVYERNCGAIIMLSGIMENEEEVCCQYWPVNGVEQYGEFAVSALEESMHDGFLERIFSLTDSKVGQVHRVSQFQLLNWGPDGQSSNPTTILNAISCILNVQRRSGNSPIVIHCSDTVNRSGVFCAVVIAIEACKVEGTVDVFQTVKALRIQKPGAVPTMEQYQFIHELVQIFIGTFSTYSNFK